MIRAHIGKVGRTVIMSRSYSRLRKQAAMSSSLFFVSPLGFEFNKKILLSLSILVSCYNTQFGAFNVDSMTLIYRGVYLYDEKDSPRVRYECDLSISL